LDARHRGWYLLARDADAKNPRAEDHNRSGFPSPYLLRGDPLGSRDRLQNLRQPRPGGHYTADNQSRRISARLQARRPNMPHPYRHAKPWLSTRPLDAPRTRRNCDVRSRWKGWTRVQCRSGNMIFYRLTRGRNPQSNRRTIAQAHADGTRNSWRTRLGTREHRTEPQRAAPLLQASHALTLLSCSSCGGTIHQKRCHDGTLLSDLCQGRLE